MEHKIKDKDLNCIITYLEVLRDRLKNEMKTPKLNKLIIKLNKEYMKGGLKNGK